MFPYRYLTWWFCPSLLWLPPPIIFNYRLICYLRVGNILKDIKHFILIHFSSISSFYGVSILPLLNLLTISSHNYSCFLYCVSWDFACRNSLLIVLPIAQSPYPFLGELFLHVITPFSVWGLEISDSANVFIMVLGLHEDGLLVGIFW